MLRIISGIRKGALIHEVDRENTRPTTDRNKEMVFNSLGQYFTGGACLDLFAGSGSLGLEALSRGFATCTFVDNSSLAISTIKKNLLKLRFAENPLGIVVKEDVLSYISTYDGPAFALILIDPPYLLGDYDNLMLTIAKRSLTAPGGQIVVETARDKELARQYGDLVLSRDKISGNSRFWFYTNTDNPLDKGGTL